MVGQPIAAGGKRVSVERLRARGTYSASSDPKRSHMIQLKPKAMALDPTTVTQQKRTSSRAPHTRSRYLQARGRATAETSACGVCGGVSGGCQGGTVGGTHIEDAELDKGGGEEDPGILPAVCGDEEEPGETGGGDGCEAGEGEGGGGGEEEGGGEGAGGGGDGVEEGEEGDRRHAGADKF